MLVLAKYIETDLWNKVIDLMLAEGWEIIYQYDGIDAGIDFGAYTLKKGQEEVEFEWTNWDEGEIRCTVERLKQLEKLIGQDFKKKESINVQPRKERGGSPERPGDLK